MPIFFIQERISRKRKFNIYKFKTMINKKSGLQVTNKNDPRITILGKLLRKYKLDELPQLFNILKGSMSFIGPRPESIYFLRYYPNSYFSYFNYLRPGLFDQYTILNLDESDYLAKFKEPEEEYINNIIPKKSLAAKEYYDNISLRYDLIIIFNYIKKIICLLLQNGRRKN